MPFLLLLLIAVGALWALWLAALIEVLRTPQGYAVGNRPIWIVVLVLLAPLGMLAFFVLGKPRGAESTAMRWARWGIIGMGIAGGIVGLVVGLNANPPTAPFAVFELGVPAAIAGGVLGFVSGAFARAVARMQ